MLNASILNPIKAWKSGGKTKICVGVDLGGSGLRARISSVENKNQYVDIPHIPAKSTKSLVDSLTNIQNLLKKTEPTVESHGAAIAVAGPIKNGTVVLTNWPGSPELRTLSLSHLPQLIFPQNKSVFLNDLEAGAYGIVAADEQKIIEPLFTQLWKDVAPSGPVVSDSRTAVMALGSGLGAALIVNNPLSNERFVLPCELGHVQVPVVGRDDPGSQEEYDLVHHVSKFYYGGKQAPEFEDLSSGRGIKLCYQHFLQKYEHVNKNVDDIDSGDVAVLANKGNKAAKAALLWCYKLYLRLGKMIGTSLQCDSIVMALDNQVKNAAFVDSISDELKEEFYNFIRPDWMKGIRVYSQTKVLNFNILGCDYVAHQADSKYKNLNAK